MLKLENITKKYGYFTALDSVSFSVKRGEIAGLIGENGAGKTTVLKLITKYLKADLGTVSLEGDGGRALSYIADEPVYYEFMTVGEHLEFVSSMYKNGVCSVKEVIERFRLEEQLNKMPHLLSKGNKQKLMIAMALLREFDLLIADEPFTGLDPKQTEALKKTIAELKARNKAVLISTHLLDTIELFCDRYIMIEKGKIIGAGTKKEIAEKFGLDSRKTIEELYIAVADNAERERRNEKSSQADDIK